MDKVIIDGIDVSGCEFFSDMSNGKPDTRCEYYKDMYGFNTNCKHNKDAKNCYYKQLKRKEQECEKLKWLLETKCQSEWEKENAELKAENEKLKTDIGIYKGIIDADKEENERLKEENYGLNQELLGYKKGVQASEIIELKQALQEIRDIVREETETRMLFADEKSFCDFCKIQAKINEVIGAE